MSYGNQGSGNGSNVSRSPSRGGLTISDVNALRTLLNSPQSASDPPLLLDEVLDEDQNLGAGPLQTLRAVTGSDPYSSPGMGESAEPFTRPSSTMAAGQDDEEKSWRYEGPNTPPPPQHPAAYVFHNPTRMPPRTTGSLPFALGPQVADNAHLLPVTTDYPVPTLPIDAAQRSRRVELAQPNESDERPAETTAFPVSRPAEPQAVSQHVGENRHPLDAAPAPRPIAPNGPTLPQYDVAPAAPAAAHMGAEESQPKNTAVAPDANATASGTLEASAMAAVPNTSATAPIAPPPSRRSVDPGQHAWAAVRSTIDRARNPNRIEPSQVATGGPASRAALDETSSERFDDYHGIDDVVLTAVPATPPESVQQLLDAQSKQQVQELLEFWIDRAVERQLNTLRTEMRRDLMSDLDTLLPRLLEFIRGR